MRCPRCASSDDRVVDSREIEDGVAVRRRRECLACSYRYTTFERSTRPAFFIEKRSGEREPFERAKVLSGVRSAFKNRPVSDSAIDQLVNEVESAVRSLGLSASSTNIGIEVLDRLRSIDEVAYLRFASVYKDFADANDFAREADLLQKATAPKHHNVTSNLVEET